MLITSDNMNAHTNSSTIDSKMKEEVVSFAERLKSNIDSGGRKSFYSDIPGSVDGEKFIAGAMQISPMKYSHLAQIYWAVEPGNNIYISVSLLPIMYQKNGVSFGKTNSGKKYFVLGPGKYSEMKAKDMADDFYQHLRQVELSEGSK